MLNNHLKVLQQYDYNRKEYATEENEDDPLLLSYTSKSMLTITKVKDTQELVGIQQKPDKIIDWLPIICIIAAAIICFVACIILCKRQINHHDDIYLQLKRRKSNQNKNNHHVSTVTYDAAECIDGDIEFLDGIKINLARGSITLDDNDAHMLNAMNAFDRLQYFQTLTNHVK